MTGGLAAFLAARLGEDERYIRALQAAGERFRDNATPAQFGRDTPLVHELFDGILDDPEAVAAITAVQDAGAPNDLERLLREVAAGRLLLIELAGARLAYTQASSVCIDTRDRVSVAKYDAEIKATYAAWRAIQRLAFVKAAVYSGHPDYRPAWNPEEL